MKDTEFKEKRGKIDPVWRKVKRDILESQPNAERWQLIELAGEKPELNRAMDAVGNPFFREFYLRDMLSDKSGPRSYGDQGDDGRQGYFDLGEVIVIHSPKGEGKQKMRADLTRDDMVQIGKQKKLNITLAQRAKKLWDWECQLIFPFFDAHPDWLYRQCYDALCTQLGGEPPLPPKFDD